eukprot:14231063-Alexandrium_andersonii.AAC.1
MHDYHIDLIFKRLLIDSRWQEPNQLGACYIVHPIGSFREHVTGCSMDRKGQRIAGLFGLKG